MPDNDKPSSLEDEYFALEEIEKKRRLAAKQADELAQRQKAELKKLHYLKCPKCGMDLHTLKKGAVEIDTCFNCRGLWLDAGELEQLMKQGSEHSGSVMKAVLNIFGKKP